MFEIFAESARLPLNTVIWEMIVMWYGISLTSLHILSRYFHVSFKVIYSRSKRVKCFSGLLFSSSEQCLPMLFLFLQGRQCYPCPMKEGTKSQREVKWLPGSPAGRSWQSRERHWTPGSEGLLFPFRQTDRLRALCFAARRLSALLLFLLLKHLLFLTFFSKHETPYKFCFKVLFKVTSWALGSI